jgi:transposase
MLGVDVSKGSLSGALVDAVTRRVLWEGTVPNSAAGVRELLRRSPRDCAWVLEPTGRYSVAVAAQARAEGRAVLLAPPKEAKYFLRSLQGRAKTDRLDSRGLALFGLSRPLRPYPVKGDAVDKLDQLLAARRGIARSLASLKQQAAGLPQAGEALGGAIAGLRRQRGELDRQIAALVAAEGEFAAASALARVPGIGALTAAAVVSCLRAKRFSHPDQFVSHVGLDVRVRESGQHKGRRKLTRQGDAELRRLLYLCAQASLRSKDGTFRAQYERELAKGLPTTAALCAVARKMARLCWSLVRHGTAYDAGRVYRQPEPAARPTGEGATG